MIVAPSLFAANAANYGEAIVEVEKYGAKFLHIDVMDGHFVPNLSFGPNIVEGIRPVTKMVFDVHLMIEEPQKFLKPFIEAGSDIITVHYEAVSRESLRDMAHICTANNVGFGVSLRPQTQPDEIAEYMPMLDLLLIMSINPGFGGQDFQPQAINRISRTRELREKTNSSFKISVDGGINEKTGPLCTEAGADVLVAGTYIFKAPDKEKAIRALCKNP